MTGSPVGSANRETWKHLPRTLTPYPERSKENLALGIRLSSQMICETKEEFYSSKMQFTNNASRTPRWDTKAQILQNVNLTSQSG